MEKHENRRVTMTKRMIKEAMIELLKEKSIHHIAVKELCDRADVNRTTFYKYYGNQFDLFQEMENDLITTVNHAIAQSGDRHEKAVCIILRYMENHLELSRLLINNNIDPAFPQKFLSQDVIRQEVERSFGVRQDDPMREYLCQFLFAGLYQVLRTWLNKKERDPVERIAELITGVRLTVAT